MTWSHHQNVVFSFTEKTPVVVLNHRPCGCLEFTYDRGIYKALRTTNVDKNSWYDLAVDKTAWKNVLNGL